MMDPSIPERTYDIASRNCQDGHRVDEGFLSEVARRCLAQEGVRGAAISIALVDNSTIRRLNRDYLDHDFETDVLSFLFDVEPGLPGSPLVPQQAGVHHAAANDAIGTAPARVLRGTGKRIEGEVILSVEMAVQSASRYAWSPQDELTLCLVHGLLHLCGYEDGTDSDREQMRVREREILDSWGLKPSYDEVDRAWNVPPNPAASTIAGAEP